MNTTLERLAAEIGLDEPSHERLKLQFAFSCVSRVEYLLEESDVIACLQTLGRYLDGEIEQSVLEQVRVTANTLANQHRGSKSIDGCGHAAVSASYAVANACNGKALQAASYAAYAKIYADGGYGAVADREAFEPEFSWQVGKLRALTQHTGAHEKQIVGTNVAGVA